MTDWPRYAEQAIADYGAQQHPFELGALLAILAAYDTMHVVELGTWSGGLTWALCQLPQVERVVTVDTGLQPGWITGPEIPDTVVKVVQGDTTKRATRDAVEAQLPDEGPDVLVIDGGHDRRTVVNDWNNYHTLLKGHGLVVFHDTQGYPGRPDVEVPGVWQTIRRGYRSMELVAVPGGPYGTGIIWLG